MDLLPPTRAALRVALLKSWPAMPRDFRVVLGLLLAISGVLYVGIIALSSISLTRLDPYPAFMAKYQPNEPIRSYDEAKRRFGEFVGQAFPIGSDAGQAIAEIAGGGFKVATSGPDSIELVWKRTAGPCSEVYSIIIHKDSAGKIAKTSGRLSPICL